MNGNPLIERTFDNQNREATRTAGSNTQSQLHDRYGCLIKRKWQGQQSATRRYRWDAENRLEATQDNLTGDTHYQRDSQGQLIHENDTTYHYDLGGNRLPEGGQIEQDRLIRSGDDKRTYDALGAEVRITGQTTEHRTFDAEGQLIEFKRPEQHITYGYDALGRRAWRKTDAGTTTYLWHNDVLLGEQSPSGQWQWYLRDPQTDEPLITLIDNQPYYYELDHRMMPVRLWDQEGQKVWEGNADAWGKCQPDTLNHGIHQSLRLPGQFEDELTGIVQNRFRDYDPATGRYLTPDPLGLKGGLNAYRYTKNPLDFVDPLGLEFKAVITPENAETGEDAPILDNLEPVQEIPVPESQLSQRHLRETVGLDTVVVGPNGHGETIGAMYGKVYDPEGNQLPGVDNQAVEAFNDALRQAEKTREYRAEGYKMVAQDAALGMAAGPAAGIVAGGATKAAGSLVSKAKGAFGALRKADVPNKNVIDGLTELDPRFIRTTQTTTKQQGATLRALTESMQKNGFQVEPDKLIDVVRMPDGGLTSLDNTRIVAADLAGVKIQARVHNFDDLLPNDEQFISRFIGRKGEVPTNWGEAVKNRISNQSSLFRNTYPEGSPFISYGKKY
ncbi:RHS repeat domain-containing protein [Marinobacter fuscus]|uniref:RHS repeat domain-containing protein n=1 Tax=Marinobacter fuscus TaxID=2109942 RepID=UPI001F0BBF44|nr:RHS repeat-associated core domain-containing protein [Marinobacter fuscus]